MKKLILFPFIIVSLFITSFTITSCSNGVNIPEPVCHYGEITCNTINYLCSNYPEIPPQVCELSNIACVSLSLLCSTQPGTDEHQRAKESLEYVNTRLSVILDSLKLNEKR